MFNRLWKNLNILSFLKLTKKFIFFRPAANTQGQRLSSECVIAPCAPVIQPLEETPAFCPTDHTAHLLPNHADDLPIFSEFIFIP